MNVSNAIIAFIEAGNALLECRNQFRNEPDMAPVMNELNAMAEALFARADALKAMRRQQAQEPHP